MGIVIALLLAVTVFAFVSKNKKAVIEGKYERVWIDTGDTYKEFYPSNAEKTEGTYKDVIYDPTDEGKFVYTYYIKDNLLYLNNIMGTTEYEIWGDYLIPVKYSYEGDIPKGNTFDATCIYEDNKIVFSKDGTVKNGDKTGTYTRNDEIITVSYEDSEYTYYFSIYKNKINNSALKKAK
ncbi:MAG: hypothetical protein HDR08_11180 [Lachnospiraceae bacterium]|nr:hypothetical protein [Lachnospiraceae bacterium]